MTYTFTACSQVYRLKSGYGKPSRPKGPQQKSLRIALAALPQLIDEATRGKDDLPYWQGFSQEALAEVEAIIGGGE